MLQSNSKVYVVSEFGGEYEDKWEHIIGVCLSLELAEELRTKTLSDREVKTNISPKEYQIMLDTLYRYEDEHGEICDSEVEGVHKLFPNYKLKDIEAADKRYYSYDDFIGVDIQEINLYN